MDERHAPQVRQLRGLVITQLVTTSVLSAILALALGGTAEPFPPLWALGGLAAVLVAAVVNVERSWTRIPPLPAGLDADTALGASLAHYQRHLARALFVLEIPLLLAILYAFVMSYGGWPVIVLAIATVVVIAVETWPTVRNTTRVATALEADGTPSGLVEAFDS
ncbi:hypothetical protein BHE97_14820 [Aeromicrobium sp. PE09-221]|uniref:hypothetical protein n=1 Tax=Aeromicrobium sp. PE09-221 TaxID=1898043 RepID=UPI000762818B|nr:hypothetical protein [Aeromicrobium sp. PE09-221]KWU68382.1 hypothetical protein AWX17_27485 [Priestia megaterium]OUZ07971.1 hypothetical protein BHE97_14820 [Aeromicrobium sp. PE09-221]